MKFILCTGDSHTQGEGAKGFYNRVPTEWVRPYNSNGEGFGYTRLFSGCDCYVNLLRDYINKATGSEDEMIFIATDKPYEDICSGMTFDCEKGDALIFTFAAKQEESVVSFYADGVEVRKKKLITNEPRHVDISVWDVYVDCKGVQKVEIFAEKGVVNIISARLVKGEYAVINCGAGCCDSKRYYEKYVKQLIDEFSPWMFVAEAHTINDWLSGKTPEEYKKYLDLMINEMKNGAQNVLVLVPSPIIESDNRPTVIAKYKEYIEKIYELVTEKNYEMVDAYSVMWDEIKNLTDDEKYKVMLKDQLHVNDHGHKIYADMIFEKISGLIK